MTAEELLALVSEYGKLTRRIMVQPTPENLDAGDEAFGAIATAVYGLGLPVDSWCNACAGEGGPHKSWCAGGFELDPEPRAYGPAQHCAFPGCTTGGVGFVGTLLVHNEDGTHEFTPQPTGGQS
ncbi:hypothetical protein KXS11_03500 [Plantibacter flavus]|uniref:hypothetical protein n=1 Tax=Plantibacter flavus TaxID=150123 RepID=UPI003F16A983